MAALDEQIALGERGIHPVAPRHRVLGALDLAVLWGDLGIGLLVMVTGALLVPALGFWSAAAVVVVGSSMGVALLALTGAAGARHAVPTMVLLRPVLGIRGSWVPSLLNVAQLVGWTAVELWAMSYVADLVARQTLGISARYVWLAIAAIFCTGLAVWGPVGVTRVWMEKFAAWTVAAISVAVTLLVFVSGDAGEALASPGTGGWPTMGAALDLVIAMPVSWLPLVADYTRFASDGRSAFRGTFAGYFVANVWLYLVGILLVLGADATPDPAGIAGAVLALAGGTIAGTLFLAGLLAGETDEAFADIYSGAVSLQNVWPRLPQRVAAVAIGGVASVLAGWLTMQRYESFLFLLGSVFVPLFGVLAADHFVTRRGRLDASHLYRRGGTYWFRGGFRPAAFVAWAAGVVAYHWIAPTGPQWWVDSVSGWAGGPLAARWTWLPASLPAFAIAFLAGVAMGRRYHPHDVREELTT